jgi:cobalamin biosynthesis protein CbiG
VIGANGHAVPAQRVSIQLAGVRAGAPAFTAMTSETGAYEIENIPPGDYILTVSAPGVKTYTLRLSIQPGQAMTENARLEIAVLVIFAQSSRPSLRAGYVNQKLRLKHP